MMRFIAHRGDPILHRENTIQAFVSAEKNGADMIELDVQLSRDGKCVILHDDTLERLWNVNAAVKDLRYDEIREVTSKEEYEIPLLEDVIQAVNVPMMIDVKYKECIDPIVHTLRKTNAIDRALIVGGNLDAHARVRELLPDVQTGLSWDTPHLPSFDLLHELRFNFFNPAWPLIMEVWGTELITHMHERGFRVSVWTVDDESVMWNLAKSGVDAMVSNRTCELKGVYQTRLSQGGN